MTMFKKEFRKSIQYKFLSVISIILFLSTIVLSAVVALNEQEMLRHSLITKGRGLASYIAKLSPDPLIMKDYIQLDSFVNEANKDEDLIYIIVQDAKGNIITSQYSSINYRSPRLSAILSGLSKDSELQDIIAAIKNKEAVTELSAPILTGADTIGKVTVCLSEQKIHQEMIKTILFVIALNLVVAFVLGVVFFVAAKKIILTPIAELAHAAARLAKGDLSTQVTAKATGELQILVDSFNRMAENLDKTTVSKEELELKVHERTTQLLDAQEELVRKEKLATLGQLSGSVGHELRNPLGVISNAIYFLKTVMPDANETIREYLGIIRNEVDNSQRIISDLLDFARAKTPQAHTYTANELIAQSLGKCSIPDNITVQAVIPETLPMIKVDPLQMGQVFQNLIINAVHAMPNGGSLRIKAEEDKENGALKISIADTGEGISPENMKKLFQPLVTTKARGIGLGLVVSKKLTEANSGKIEVESELGKGTTFAVTLPVER